MRPRIALITLALAGAPFVGCGAHDDRGDEGQDGTGGAPIVLATGGFGAQDLFTWRETSDGRCELSSEDLGCNGAVYENEAVPLDIYVMFDRSGSMCKCADPPMPDAGCDMAGCSESRLEAIRRAFGEFLADPESRGVGVGLGFFGQLPLGQTSCDPGIYAPPAVPIGALPGQVDALLTALGAAEPVGETPTGAAIRGACTTAQERKREAPSHEVVILLLTDGEPKAPITCPESGTCCPDLADAKAAATACAQGSPGIRTYVLGVGPFLSNLGQIAEGGGSKTAHLVEGGDVANQVLQALREIRGDAQIPCRFMLPTPATGEALNLDEVNMAFATADCQGSVIFHVATPDQCGEAGGWYYDDPAAPASIELCPVSCDTVAATAEELVYNVGCTTLELPH